MLEQLPEQTRFTVKLALLTAVIGAPTLWYFSRRHGDQGLIDIPMIILATLSVCSLLAVLPLNIGRALAASSRPGSPYPGLVYIAWCLFIVWGLANGLDDLWKLLTELPSYLDSHGALLLGFLGLGFVLVWATKHGLAKRCDFFALAPTAALIVSMWMGGWLYKDRGLNPNAMHAEASSALANYIVVMVVATVAALIGYKPKDG
jgi:hypothetical protein